MLQAALVAETRPLPLGLGGGTWQRLSSELVAAPVGATAELCTATALVARGPGTPVADSVTTSVDPLRLE